MQFSGIAQAFYRRGVLILSLCFFVLSFLPLGGFNTYYGPVAIVLSITLLCLLFSVGVITFAFVRRCPKSMTAWLPRLLFGSSESLFLSVIFLLFFLVCLGVSGISFQHVPIVLDSILQFIHAKILAGGAAALPAPSHSESFYLDGMVAQKQYFSIYPPGHMVLLAVGHFIHAPWLINPLVGALSCLAIYFLAKELYGEKTARIAAFLSLVSPLLIIMSSEYMNHATALLCAVLFTLCFLKTVNRPRFSTSILAGFFLGYLCITRPYTAFAYTLPFGLYALWLLIRAPARYWRSAGGMALGTVPPLVFLLLFNAATTGNPLTFGYQALHQNAINPGFGPVPESFIEHVKAPVHTLWHGIGNSFNNINGMHFYLFRWPGSSLIFVLAAFLLGRQKTPAYLFLCACLSLSVHYVLYFYQDFCFGPRFLYETSALLIILSASGIMQTPLIFRTLLNIRAVRIDRVLLFVFVCAVFGLSLGMQTPYNFCHASGSSIAPAVERLGRLKQALVFVESGLTYERLAALYYPPSETGSVILALDLEDKKNRALMTQHPERTVYRWTGIDTPDENFRLVRPPLLGQSD